MQRVVFDTCAVKPLVDQPGAYGAARATVDDGRVEILFTHVTIEELAVTPEADRRCRLLLALISLGRLVPTGDFVLDTSRWDYARWSADAVRVEALRAGKPRHTKDALIAATAAHAGCALVTLDGALTHHAQTQRIEVLRPMEFLAGLGFTPMP